MSVAFFVCTILVRADDYAVLLVDELVHFGAYLLDCGFVFLMSAAAIECLNKTFDLNVNREEKTATYYA